MENKKLDMDQIGQELLKRRRQEIEDLESCSKPLYELVIIEKFIVDEVIAESCATSFSPRSERIFGGVSFSYGGGFTSRLILKVSPDNCDVPVRTLNFDGFSVVKAGDYISAQIPRYEEKKINGGFHSGPYNWERMLYFDRDFSPEESAIELVLLSKDGKVLRRDRAINYKMFVR